MTTGIAGRVAVVTGAAGGMGAAVTRALAAHGAIVAALDVDGSGVEKVAAELPEGVGHGYRVDVRDAAAVDAAVTRIEDELGPVRILVTVAGILRTGPFTGSTTADWTRSSR